MSELDVTLVEDAGATPHESVQSDTHSDYRTASEMAAASMRRGVWRGRFPERFVQLEARQLRSDLPRAAIDAVAQGKHYASYRGLPMAKDPFDRVLYETLFYEIQPRTVVELGAYTGASAMWMADILQTFCLECRVIAADIDLNLIDDAAWKHPGVEFLEGDLNEVEELFTPEMLAALPRPLVLIDDAHVNLAGVYAHFDRYALGSGDYLVIEDTIPHIPATFGPEASSGATADDWGDWKWEEVLEFFRQCDSQYLVDRYYTDFFGYNATWNWNGYLRKS